MGVLVKGSLSAQQDPLVGSMLEERMRPQKPQGCPLFFFDVYIYNPCVLGDWLFLFLDHFHLCTSLLGACLFPIGSLSFGKSVPGGLWMVTMTYFELCHASKRQTKGNRSNNC